ncbi:unnamed protein product [Prunus armeniaca]|uniref:Fatty acid hydroxylase domain-containing protein n=1 Tax=Prunus armeniaca TaxID=36596 RepID=A0A6J5XA33_PRUAR|nr:unnamed protein product [Prunus armeniaca]
MGLGGEWVWGLELEGGGHGGMEREREREREKEHNLQNLPLWNTIGFISTLVLHMGVSEPLYYWMHRRFHGNYFFENYHSLHHSSPIPQPFTGKIINMSTDL